MQVGAVRHDSLDRFEIMGINRCLESLHIGHLFVDLIRGVAGLPEREPVIRSLRDSSPRTHRWSALTSGPPY